MRIPIVTKSKATKFPFFWERRRTRGSFSGDKAHEELKHEVTVATT
ncbi:MAG: hypothetical protein ABSB82_22395 [Terriglobia bacterium]|jgi:hypothetical protein